MSRMAFAEVLEAIERTTGRKPVKSGDNYRAVCPAHDDRVASLSVAQGSDGGVLLHCHAGCGFREIFRALRKPGAGSPRYAQATPDTAGGLGQEVARYRYCDEQGAHLFDVIRYSPKAFRQCMPDGAPKLNGVRRVLYRLPSVLAAKQQGQPIYVVEGEKDVETLVGWGLVATCNPMGAGKWRQEYAESLRGANVVIIPDTDRPGRAHAEAIAHSLQGVATRTRMIDVPDGKDVSEWAERGGNRTEIEALVARAPAWVGGPELTPRECEDKRPVFEYSASALHEAVAHGCAALTRDGRVFQRSQMLVSVVSTADDRAGGIQRDRGAPVIVPLAPARIQEILSECVAWHKHDGRSDGVVPCAPPKDVVAVIYDRKEWPGIPVLAGVTTAPILRRDGTVLTVPGYDNATGFLYVPAGPTAAVPEHPTRTNAEAAVATLLDAVSDFPFASDADRSAWLAAALSPVALAAVDNAPLFLIDAPTPGTGKTLLADVIGVIATGKRMARSPYVGRDEDDEMRKRITAHAIAGDSLILVDNVQSGARIGWPSLDSVLTGTEWCDRDLGRSRLVRLPFRAVWFATGNNVGVQADAARRVLRVRLEAAGERPEERGGFRHDPLLAWVAQERPRLLGAVLTILRAYVDAGRPAPRLTPFGSFEAWSALVRAALVWLGQADPVETSAARDPDIDPEREAHGQALAGWFDLDPKGHGLTATEALEMLEQGASPLLKAALGEICPTKDGSLPTAQKLGYRLRALRGRPRRVSVQGETHELAFEALKTDHRDGMRRWVVRDMQNMAGHCFCTVLETVNPITRQSIEGARKHPPQSPACPAAAAVQRATGTEVAP